MSEGEKNPDDNYGDFFIVLFTILPLCSLNINKEPLYHHDSFVIETDYQ